MTDPGRPTAAAPGRRRALWVALVVVLGIPAMAAAQHVVVGKFSDRTGRGTGRGARNAMAAALDVKGAQLRSYSEYLQIARRLGYRKSRAFSRQAIRKLARRLGLAGVVTGSASRSRGRTWITVKLYGPNGRLWMKETIAGRRSGLSPQAAEALADKIMNHLGPGDGLPAENSPPPYPPEADPSAPDLATPDLAAADSLPVEPAPSPASGVDDGWGEPLLAGDSGPAAPPVEVAPGPAPAIETRPAQGPYPAAKVRQAPEIRSRPSRRPRSEDERVDDAWLAVGTGVHLRSGLKPLHTTDAFPGLRFDGRMFLRPLYDRGPWADVGIGFSVDFSLGLAYRYRGQDTWYDASQTQWRVELLYRWAQRGEWIPSLIVKLGVSGTHSSVTDSAALAVDASYIGPHLGLDAVWNLHGPLLRGVISLDALVAAAGGDLDATSGGVHLFLGLQSVVLGWFQLDVGYDLTYYGFDDSATGSSSDTYHAILLRLGYVYK